MVSDDERTDAIGAAQFRLLRRVASRLTDLIRDRLEPIDLTPSQAFAIIAIADKRGLSQASLVKALDSDANTVSGIVRRLEQRGVLTRARRPADPRLVSLALTADGEELARAAAQQIKRLERAIGHATAERTSTVTTRWMKDLLALDVD